MEPTANDEKPAGAASGLTDGLCVTNDELIDLLEYLFEMYENGPSCYEDPDGLEGYLGNAIHIGDAEFSRIADILNAHRPRTCNAAN